MPIKEGFDFGKTIVRPIDDFGKGIQKSMNKTFSDIGKDIKKTGKKAGKGINKGLNEAKKPFKGIEKAIKDFGDIIVQFSESIPPRFNNVFAGIDNIFKGVFTEMGLLAKNIFFAIERIGVFLSYCFEFLGSHLRCGVKFTKNILDCIFYYIIDLIWQLFYLPVRIVMWVLYTFLGIDLYYIEDRTYNGMKALSKITFYYFGFHLIYWPKTIREKCYTCVRLKKKAVRREARIVDDAFNKKIPASFGDGKKFYRKADRHFKEFNKWPKVRQPSKVK
tara:strand:+ start:694 stop:1521 length:828 start_codon:yes stop_codon:yes gene_type:complete